MNTLEYVTGSFVFRLQATANGYDSHVRIYTRRHFDNCLRNGTMPWAMVEIKVKTDNGEFVAFDPEYDQFVDFCEMWITNPHETLKKVNAEIAESEHNTRITQLHDFPYTVHTTNDYESTVNTMVENTRRILDLS